MNIRGYLFEPGSSKRIEATLSREDGTFRLDHGGGASGFYVEILKAGDRLAGIPQALTLSTGQRFVPFEELPVGFLATAETRTWRFVVWLERFSPTKAIVLVALLVLGLMGLRAAVPVAADLVATLVPVKLEAAVGRETFREIDAVLLSPSELSGSRIAGIKSAAHALAKRGGIDPIPEVYFRDAPKIGANAFALPGGPILVTDDLVHVLEEDNKILAVMAHEFGHVEERHGLRQVLRVGGMFLIASMVVGADDSMIEELVALAVSTTTLGYSRDFERDADSFAGRLLESAGRPSDDLADALEALQENCGEACRSETSWLSTHPAIESRIKALSERR